MSEQSVNGRPEAERTVSRETESTAVPVSRETERPAGPVSRETPIVFDTPIAR